MSSVRGCHTTKRIPSATRPPGRFQDKSAEEQSESRNAMGVFDVIRGRQDSQIVEDLAVTEDRQEPKNDSDLETPPASSEDSDEGRRLSREAANEKSIEKHPDEITRNAYAGVQKAEAAALVWSKKAVILTYAW